VTMLLGGLWHGANWTFVAWGALHGFGLSIERFFFGHRNQDGEAVGWRKWRQRAIMFHVGCLTWLFFRAESIPVAVTMSGQLGHFRWSPHYAAAWLLLGILGGLGLLIDLKLESTEREYIFQGESPVLRLGAAVTAVAAIMLFGASQGNAFIYF